MNIKKITLATFIALTGFQVTAQDLSTKIPAEAKFVVSINNKGIVENSSPEILKDALINLGFFKDSDTELIKVFQSDFNLDKQAYFYFTSTDSVQYIGFLAPLKENHQIKERLFLDYDVLPASKNHERRVSKDGETQVAWNKENLLILTGNLNDQYFQTKEMSDRFGLEFASNNTSDWNYIEEFAATADSTWVNEEENFIEEPSATYDTVYIQESVEEPISVTELAEATVDATYEQEYPELTEAEDVSEAYEDEWNWYSHLLSPEQEAKNDSIKKELFKEWISNDLISFINPENNLGNNKVIKISNNNHLARIWIPNLEQLYNDIIPNQIVSMVYNLDMKNLKYGYNDATFDLIQDQYNLKFTANINVDNDLADYLKKISKNSFNKKLTNYIPKDYITYSSLNISTEEYLKQLPEFITRWYMPIVKDESFGIIATALEISLDEKAIGKVAKGDNLLFINELKKVTREYVTYDYDDDYNYEEIKETKEEYVPDYLWMFTSEDQRLFIKILEYAISKEQVTFENGIYKKDAEYNTEAIYFLFKDNIVFVSSNLEQLSAINENRFENDTNSKIKKEMQSNPFNLRIKTAAIPEITTKLELPVSLVNNETLETLSEYGDIKIKVSKMKKNTINSEMSIELPKRENNALEYIFKNLITKTNLNSINEL